MASVAFPTLRAHYIEPRSYGVVSGAGQSQARRLSNRAAMETATAASVASKRMLLLPEDVIEIEFANDGSIPITGSVCIEGRGKGLTTLDIYPKAITADFDFDVFNVTGAGNLKIQTSNFSVTGTNAPTNPEDDETFFLRWWSANSQGSILDVDGLEITGLIGNAISRSGGGTMRVTNSEINAYLAPLTFFESSDTSGTPQNGLFILSDSDLTNTSGKDTGIGVYIHPNICGEVTNTLFRDCARYGIYQNGSPTNRAEFFNVDNCAFQQTRGLQVLSKMRVSNSSFYQEGRDGGPINLETESASFVNCRFSEVGIGSQYLVNEISDLSFTGCEFDFPAGYSITFGSPYAENWKFSDCRYILYDSSSVCECSSFALGKVHWDNCTVDHRGTISSPNYPFNVINGEFWFTGLRVRNSKIAAIRIDGSTSAATLHLNDVDVHGDGGTSLISINNSVPSVIDGGNIRLSGTITTPIVDGSSIQQRLTRRPGVNPTAVASAATIDTNVAAWCNYNTHAITGSTDIATLSNPFAFNGIVYLVPAASSNFAILSSGNITPIMTAKRVVGATVALIWEPTAAKWREVVSGLPPTGDMANWTINSTIIGNTTRAKGSFTVVSSNHTQLTYSASITPTAATANVQTIQADNGNAFTINNPSGADFQRLVLIIKNSSGGALGTITWGALYKMAAWVSPATGFCRSIEFHCDGNDWRETFRTPADVPN